MSTTSHGSDRTQGRVEPACWTCGHDRLLSLDRPRLMGIVNVTPDSFSDGGRFREPEEAAAAALAMVDDGADIIDIGGESTRPGAARVKIAEQIRRVVPVIERVRAQSDVLISIDTTRSEVAAAALDAGADVINDVAAGTEDEGILTLAAQRSCGLVLMHRRTRPEQDSYSDQYDSPPQYTDVVAEVKAYLHQRCAAAMAAGVSHSCIVVDPGAGFGKSVQQNYRLLRRISEFGNAGLGGAAGVLCAVSRKSFIGAATGGVTDPTQRLAGSLAAAVMCYAAGVRLFRVHDVQAHREALAVAAAVFEAEKATN